MSRSAIVLCLASVAIGLSAQEAPLIGVPRSFPRLQLNLKNPGARSLGMGGAFLGLADDASAAEANPAGLTILRKPEISLELRRHDVRQFVPTAGTFPDIDRREIVTRDGPLEVSFVSGVWPLSRGVVAVYYHDLFSYHKNVLFEEAVLFFSGPGGPVSAAQCAQLGALCRAGALLPEDDSIDVQLSTYAVAGAWRFDRLSVGGALRYHEGKISLMSSIFGPDGSASGIIGEDVTGRDVTFTAGAHWRATDMISLGAVYKKGPEATGRLFLARPPSVERVTLAKPTNKIPDLWGFGVAIRPHPVLTITLDAVRIEYSDLLIPIRQTVLQAGDAFRAPDGTELRAGAEYFFKTSVPFAIRAGWWREPPHDIEFAGALDTPSAIANRIIFPGGRSEDHMTLGFGWSWPGFSVDAAWDHSRLTDPGSIWIASRF